MINPNNNQLYNLETFWGLEPEQTIPDCPHKSPVITQDKFPFEVNEL